MYSRYLSGQPILSIAFSITYANNIAVVRSYNQSRYQDRQQLLSAIGLGLLDKSKNKGSVYLFNIGSDLVYPRQIFASLFKVREYQGKLVIDSMDYRPLNGQGSDIAGLWDQCFSDQEQSGELNWHWSDKHSRLLLANMQDHVVKLRMRFYFSSGYTKPANLILSGKIINTKIVFDNREQLFDQILTLQPGENEMFFDTDAK